MKKTRILKKNYKKTKKKILNHSWSPKSPDQFPIILMSVMGVFIDPLGL